LAMHEVEESIQTGKQRRKVLPRKTWAAVVLAVLLLALVVADFYGIHYLRAKIIRATSWAGIAAALAQGEEQQQLLRAIAINETTLLVWSYTSWAAAGLVGLAALWSAIRRRFAWRLLWSGAIATFVAALLTVIGRWVLEKHARYEPMGVGLYIAAFLAHSLPAWLILTTWLGYIGGRPKPSQNAQESADPAA
jgi:hypothetical protein